MKISQPENKGSCDYICLLCQHRFPLKCGILLHIRVTHQFAGHRCEICESLLPSQRLLKEHERVHSGLIIYHCVHCLLTFKSRRELMEHLNSQESSTAVPVQGANNQTSQVECSDEEIPSGLMLGREEVAQELQNQNDFGECPEQMHLPVSDLENEIQQLLFPESETTDSAKEYETEPLIFELDEVLQLLGSQTETENNEVSDGSSLDAVSPRGLESDVTTNTIGDSKTVPSSTSEDASSAVADKILTCSTCQKSFTLRRNLNRHIKLHETTETKACNVCGKGFSRIDNLRLHLKKFHQSIDSPPSREEKVYKSCSFCPKMFAKTALLDRHLRRHMSEKPWTCKVEPCGKKFCTKWELMWHEKVHTKEKSSSCEQCRAKFVSRSSLKRHFRRFHEIK